MAVKILSLGGTDWVNGDVLSHTDLIDTIEKAAVLVHEFYTGAGFDISGSGDTDDHELNAITSTNAAKYTYAKVTICYKATSSANAANSGIAQLKIQVKETGGAYGDEFAFTTLSTSFANPDVGSSDAVFSTITWYHTLSAGDKSNGLQFKILTQEPNGTGLSATINNISTVVELL